MLAAWIVGTFAFGLPQAAIANITYNVNQSIFFGIVVGTVTTNGTLGTISSAADFVGWSLTLKNSISADVVLNTGNSVLFASNFQFTATANSLTFNHAFGKYFVFFGK